MKRQIKGFIMCAPDEYGIYGDGPIAYHFLRSNGRIGYAEVMPYTLEFEIPDDYNPNTAFVSELEKRKNEIRAEFQKRITDIDRQIAQYTALECA